jgi:hypothetical protein
MWVRSSSRFYPTFNLLISRSPGFGSMPSDSVALLRLAFATASFENLTLPLSHKSLAHYTKGTRSHLIYIVLPLLVGPWFQVYFTPLNGVLFTFPSRYWYTIGRCYVFSLGGWSPQIQTRFHVPRPTQDTARLNQNFVYRAITYYGRTFQSVQLFIIIPHRSPTTPKSKLSGLGFSRFARRYSGNLIDFFSCGY